MGDYHDLRVWHKAHALTLAVYRLTGSFPSQETYGLTLQIRRASSSIPTNIAEGCGRTGDAELARYLRISLGSASELEYQLLLARDLGYLSVADFAETANATEEVKRMLRGLIAQLTGKDSRLMTHDS